MRKTQALGLWLAAAVLQPGMAQGIVDTGPATRASEPMAADGENRSWEVRASDVTLARTLERWSADAGHKLKWDASRNFLIGAPDQYTGTFEEALQHVLRSPGIRYSDFPLEACVYANTPPLVRITRLGEQSRECAAVDSPRTGDQP